MSLRFAILASLHNQPLTGYDIAREFDRGVGYFWQASHQQIYRELSRLTADGETEYETVAQSARPAKKIYHITPAGRAHLQAWLATPAAAPLVKDELLVRLFAGTLADRAQLLGEVRRHQAQTAARHAEYLALERQYFADPASLPEAMRFMYLTLRKGIRTTEAALRWFDEVVAFLQSATNPAG